MKKLFLILMIVVAFCFSANAQVKKDTTAKPASVPTELKPPPDSIKIISTKDLLTFLKYLKDNASVTIYSQLTPDNVITELYGWAIREYNKLTATKK